MVKDVKVIGRQIKFSLKYKQSEISSHTQIFQRHFLGGNFFSGKLIWRVKNIFNKCLVSK